MPSWLSTPSPVRVCPFRSMVIPEAPTITPGPAQVRSWVRTAFVVTVCPQAVIERLDEPSLGPARIPSAAASAATASNMLVLCRNMETPPIRKCCIASG
jgi:hypothetical protein